MEIFVYLVEYLPRSRRDVATPVVSNLLTLIVIILGIDRLIWRSVVDIDCLWIRLTEYQPEFCFALFLSVCHCQAPRESNNWVCAICLGQFITCEPPSREKIWCRMNTKKRPKKKDEWMSGREVYYNDGWVFINKRPTAMCLATLKKKEEKKRCDLYKFTLWQWYR